MRVGSSQRDVAPVGDPDSLIREEDAAAFLKFTPRALQDWRKRGSGPPFLRISKRAIRYRRGDLIAWAASRLRSR